MTPNAPSPYRARTQTLWWTEKNAKDQKKLLKVTVSSAYELYAESLQIGQI